MKVPNNCFECPLEADNKCYGTIEKKRVESLDIPTWCPLKEQYYFPQDGGTIYSRYSGTHITKEEAVKQFLDELNDFREN